MEKTKSKSKSSILLFLVPSLIGILLFMIPIVYQGEVTIPIAILSKALQSLLGDTIPYIMTIIIVLTAILTIVSKISNVKFIEKSPFFISKPFLSI